ncbi:hypothetical protein [Calidithermus roseus]|uniref:ISKra4 family transposase n=1 Tax=Calidithermus roseus TaxID=1644118 RepID=A0A399E9H5_9DEIN|nr:hypothetical protein [Calidithermus roseus]RIH81377.1 hypothetical protein Mrose_03587 [Calidithermus roseus]
MKVASLWGRVEVRRYQYRCGCGYQGYGFGDDSLDESGYFPELLGRLQDAAMRMSYREAAGWLGRWRVKVSKSQLQRLCVALEGTQQALGRERLAQQAHQALPGREQERGRRWCIEVDGSLVPTRVDGGVEWREVKSAVLYPMRAPSQRYYVSALGSAGEFAPLVHGLLRQAGVRQADGLIGISDGAVWIAELLGDLGVKRHILDVYHASTYFETLLQGLGFPEAQRAQQRRALLRGEIDLQRWLNGHLNDPSLLGALPTEARKALHFLEKQALLNHTHYPQFRREGLEVIASGQIEGANKHVIQGRLKIAGARWSVSGAHAKAFGRSQLFSLRPIVSFDTVRHVAFPAA